VQTILDQTQCFSLITSLSQHHFITTLKIFLEKAIFGNPIVRGVTRWDGARGKKQIRPPWSKFGAPMVKSEFFWRQIYCIEESTCDIVETFRRPCSDSALPQWIGARGIV